MTQQIRQLSLSPAEKQALQARYQETNNRRWQERIQCVLLKSQGLTLEAISEAVPYNINTISEWIRRYAEEGLDGICVWQYQGSPRHLDADQQHTLDFIGNSGKLSNRQISALKKQNQAIIG
jgi:transposase